MILAASNLLIGSLTLLFVFVCSVLVLAVLIQRPKGGGLSGAFGGAGGATAAFGTKTGDVLTWITIGFFVAFLALAIGMTHALKPGNRTAATATTPVTPAGSATTTGSAAKPDAPATQPASADPMEKLREQAP